MGKSKGSTTQTTGPDATTLGYMSQVWNAANAAGNSAGAPVDPNTMAAAGNFQNIANAGNLGFGALTGNAADVNRFMSPYQSQVIDQMRNQYGMQRDAVTQHVNDAATQAGAFGGSRQGVAEGVAQAQLGRDQNQQMAGLLNQGYGDAMNRAGTVANLGFGANGALGSIGEYMRNVAEQNNPDARRFGFLNQGLAAMPRGSTTTTTQTPGHNPLSGALGGAAAGSQFGPWGAAAGGLLGLFG